MGHGNMEMTVGYGLSARLMTAEGGSHIRSRALACSPHGSLSGDSTSEVLPQTGERVDIPLIHLTNTTAILSE
jgi:hypothetical protein